MNGRALETCDRCGRVGYDFRHVELAVDGRKVLDVTLCKPHAAGLEDAATAAAAKAAAA